MMTTPDKNQTSTLAKRIEKHYDEINDQLFSKGYYVIDNFLPEDECKILRDEVANLYNEKHMVPEGVYFETKDEQDSFKNTPLIHAIQLKTQYLDFEKKQVTPIVNHTVSYLQAISNAVPQVLNKTTKIHMESVSENVEWDKKNHYEQDCDGMFLEFHKIACCIGNGCALPKHLDNNGLFEDDCRKITCILYLNENWQEEYGGQLRLHLYDKPDSGYVDILPIFNRFAMFDSSYMVHEVLPVFGPKNMPPFSTRRYTITVWLRASDFSQVHPNPYLLKRICMKHFYRQQN